MSPPRPALRLIDFFDKGVAIDPDRDFLVSDEARCTYGEAQLFSHRVVNALRRDRIEPGDRAAVYSANATVAFEAVIGIIRGGCVWVPVSTRNTVADTIYVLKRTGTRVLFYSSAFTAEVKQILAACPGINRAVCMESTGPDHPGLDEWLAGTSEHSEPVPGQPEDVVTLFSSGGTTGKPKGVMMTNRCWEAMIAGAQPVMWHEHPIYLVAAPMTHAAGGSALVMMSMGTTNVMLPGFDPELVMRAIPEHRVTHFFLPPTAVYRLLAHPDVRKHDYSSLVYFNYASAPMAPEKIKEAMDVFGPVMVTGFGSTEMGINITFLSQRDHAEALETGREQRLLSTGRETLFSRAEIMDDEGGILPAGETGEIVARSNQIMKGYHRNRKETQRAFADGWYHTGDIGYKDDDGFLYLIDRKRDIIISGGFNVFPSEVEKVIVAHPAVQDCAVVGIPDDDWGEAVLGVVELKPGKQLPEEDLRKYCREKLSGFKVPKSFRFIAELPRSAAGKVLRRVVRDPYWRGRKRMI